MANVLVNETSLTNIANAIRNQNGTSTKYKPSEMAAAISNIQTGIEPTGELTITSNGTYDVTKYASAEVNVASSGGGSSEIETTTFTIYDDTWVSVVQTPPSYTVIATILENGKEVVTSYNFEYEGAGTELLIENAVVGSNLVIIAYTSMVLSCTYCSTSEIMHENGNQSVIKIGSEEDCITICCA